MEGGGESDLAGFLRVDLWKRVSTLMYGVGEGVRTPFSVAFAAALALALCLPPMGAV